MCILLSGFATSAKAQLLSETPDFNGKWIAGGNIGGGMYGNQLYLSLAPQMGYRVGKLETGLRLIYNCDVFFDKVYGNQSWHGFGVAPYANFEFYKGLFVHLEDEELYRIGVYNHEIKSREWFNSLFSGIGYRQYAGNGYGYILVLYNLSYDIIGNEESPYASPLSIRMGYCFGL